MIEGLFQPMHLLMSLGIALLIYGPRKLPEMGKGLGDAIRQFKTGILQDHIAQPNSPDGPEKS